MPPPLPHPPTCPNTDYGLSFFHLNTQTVDPLQNFATFSAKTCIELLPLLSDKQYFEVRTYNNDILKRYVDFKSTRNSRVNKVAKLKHFGIKSWKIS